MDSFTEQELYYKLDNMVLTSCLLIRKIFRNRWEHQTGESWVDEEASRIKLLEIFTPPQSKSKKCSLPEFLQKNIMNKRIAYWDMTLLSAVLMLVKSGDEEKDSKENDAIRKLKEMRNTMAHDDIGKTPGEETEQEQTNRKCTLDEFKLHSATFRDCMACLGMAENEINILIEKSGITSSTKAQDRMKALHAQAQDQVTAANYEEAVEFYNDAVLTPSLLPEDRGIAYEKRAECYLVFITNIITEQANIEQALMDANKAIELNWWSWKAHFLKAKCLRLQNKLSDAIQSYEDAFAISPVQKQVKRDMDSCKVLAGIQSRQEHLDPMFMPMNLQERVKKLENETGIKLTDDGFLILNTAIAAKYFPGQDYVFRGHQCLSGWKVKQEPTEAVKYYAKADDLGNPEGSYNLAQCYYQGIGVDQDVEKALKIYKRVAKMDRNILGECTSTGCNVGVAHAQHAIGLLYDNGVGIGRNYKEAAKWYEMGMENGVGMSANNLGILYSNGHGIPVDEENAEMCWKRALELNDINSSANLMEFYIDQLEPEKASLMLARGREMGNDALKYITDQEFDRMVEHCVAERIRGEEMVRDFEDTCSLSGVGLTFKQRITRAFEQVAPNLQVIRNVAENIERTKNGLGSKNNNWAGESQVMTDEIFEALNTKALEGSEVAKDILKGLEYNFQLGDMLDSELKVTDYSEEKKLEIVDLLYKISILDTTKLYFRSEKSENRLKQIVAKLFERMCGEKGEYDMKIRLCHCLVNLKGSLYCENDTSAIKILEVGISRYPENETYYDRLVSLLAHYQKYEEGLSYVNRAIERFPKNTGLLYSRASIMYYLERIPSSEMLKAYKDFLKVAPKEHRKVPEAFYKMSSLHIINYCKSRTEENWKIIESTFKEGESDTKKMMSMFLETGRGTLKPPISFSEPKILGVLERKPYLKNPSMQSVIRHHRELLEIVNTLSKRELRYMIPPKCKQTPAKTFSNLKPITLEEIDRSKDRIYENRVLEVLIIDEPISHLNSFTLIVQDNCEEIIHLYIHNMRRNMENMGRFQPGCRIAIINPYMQKGSMGINQGIRNDEPRCLIYLEKLESMCRFCGEEGAKHNCSVCKRPYCSRKCQAYDWSKLNHKALCSLKFRDYPITSQQSIINFPVSKTITVSIFTVVLTSVGFAYYKYR